MSRERGTITPLVHFANGCAFRYECIQANGVNFVWFDESIDDDKIMFNVDFDTRNKSIDDFENCRQEAADPLHLPLLELPNKSRVDYRSIVYVNIGPSADKDPTYPYQAIVGLTKGKFRVSLRTPDAMNACFFAFEMKHFHFLPRLID